MKKTLLATLLFSASALAHDVWVSSPFHLQENERLSAELGYGDFPVKEKIAESRLDIFPPLEIVDREGNKTVLQQQGENYQYQSSEMKKGTYWATATYRPTFWSKNADGKWARKNLQEMDDAVYCEQSQMFAKSLVIVGGEEDKNLMRYPIGQDLEIVPLVDLHQAKAGESFALQIFYEGEPLAGAQVVATSDTFIAKDVQASLDHREPQAFSGKTDEKGRVNFIPLIEGLWKVKVIHKTDFNDPKICQQKASYATLIIPVGNERAEIKHEGHSH